MAPQGLYSKDRCIGCGECTRICPAGALTLAPQGVVTERFLCEHCGSCVTVCPAEAREIAGTYESVESVMKVIKKDILFYDESGGGVTFSGGEPLMQADFLLQLLQACGANDIHRVIDTTGYADEAVLMAVARQTELFLFDLKIMDPVRHETYTGVSNQKILENLELLAHRDAAVTIRIPLIPGVNDDEDNITRTGSYLCELPAIENVDILPYHGAARYKYLRLGLDFPANDFPPLNADQLAATAQRLESFGLNVRIGG
jgi:pyruvate formate lyase activating enzyme